MGDFRVVIEGVGSHGCGRGTEADDGTVTRCASQGCSDCQAALAVAMLKRTASISVARIEHWPVPGAAGTTRESGAGPVDDLLTGKRSGRFGA